MQKKSQDWLTSKFDTNHHLSDVMSWNEMSNDDDCRQSFTRTTFSPLSLLQRISFLDNLLKRLASI